VEYKGKKTAKAMEKYVRGVKYIQEEKMKQEEAEKKEKTDRDSKWIALEPPLEEAAAEWNKEGALKHLTMANIDGFIEDGTSEKVTYQECIVF
jgi:hypothetical protein